MPPSERLWSALLPALDGSRQQLALYWLGKGRVAAGDFAGAADFFLQSATRLGADAADPLTLDARFHAARSLAQAGWRADARAQFRWLLQQAKDPVLREFIQRELATLR